MRFELTTFTLATLPGSDDNKLESKGLRPDSESDAEHLHNASVEAIPLPEDIACMALLLNGLSQDERQVILKMLEGVASVRPATPRR